jgi:hypothetical protein
MPAHLDGGQPGWGGIGRQQQFVAVVGRHGSGRKAAVVEYALIVVLTAIIVIGEM